MCFLWKPELMPPHYSRIKSSEVPNSLLLQVRTHLCHNQVTLAVGLCPVFSLESSSFTGEEAVEQLVSLSGDGSCTLETVGLCSICAESYSRLANSRGMGTASRPDPDGTLFRRFS